MADELIQPMSRCKPGTRVMAVLFDGSKREASATYVTGQGFDGLFLYDCEWRRMIAPELIKGWQPLATPTTRGPSE